jgi:hypothetical protein
MDRDDAGTPDRSDEARQGDTGMIGSEAEEPGPGRDTSLTEPDPVAAGTEQPQTTVAMSEGDPARTRLGSHVEGAGVIGYDVAASEEGTTQETPPEDRPAYAPEGDPGLAAEPVVDQGSYGQPGDASYQRQSAAAGYEGEPGGAGMAGDQEEPGPDVPATYTGEEADVAGRPEYAERAEGGADQALYQEEPQRMDRPGGGGSLFTDETPEQADRPGPQEPGGQEGVYDQDADQARRQRPSDGL